MNVFFLKVDPNYGKRYGELPKTIPGSTITSFMFALIVKWFLFFQGLASSEGIAIP